MTESDFPFVNPPEKWLHSVAVKRQPGTRWWIEVGPIRHMHQWLAELHKQMPDELLPMQWVAPYVGVTRPAVKQRIDAGMLTMFSFAIGEVPDDKQTRSDDFIDQESYQFPQSLLREGRKRFDYCPLVEVDAWRSVVIERSLQRAGLL